MKAILFSLVVLGLGCAQVQKEPKPDPLTVLLEKQADWTAEENELRAQLREAIRAGEEAERRALDIANDAKDLEEHVERLQAETRKLRNHSQEEAAARRQAESRLQQHSERQQAEFQKLHGHAKAEAKGRKQAEARLQELEQHTGRIQNEFNKLRTHAKAAAEGRQKAMARVQQLEKHAAGVQRQLAAAKKVHNHAQAAAERSHKLEQKNAVLQRQLNESYRMIEAFAAQTRMLIDLLTTQPSLKAKAQPDHCRNKKSRQPHRVPHR